jgi:hypothetical protein
MTATKEAVRLCICRRPNTPQQKAPRKAFQFDILLLSFGVA